MELKDFNPQSEAIVKKTIINKPKFKVFDVHTHMGKLLLGNDYASKYDTKEYVDALKENGVYRAVNLDGFYYKDLDLMNEKIKGFEDFFINFMWIDFDNINQDSFIEETYKLIINSYNKGCRGIKLWKDISLYKKIAMNDPRLDIVYKTAEELDIPVLMHIGDPAAFFKPISNKNERYEELSANPEWNFSNRDEFYSFEELLSMQEDIIKRFPNTNFIVAHVGSYGENLGWVSSQLKKYPNMYIDIAARIGEIGRVPYSARKFFIENQDQILFGTDTTPLTLGMHPTYYRLLETDDEYFNYEKEGEIPGQGRFMIYGLYLEDDILEKIYYKNASKLFKIGV